MFLNNKYKRWYYQIVTRARRRGVLEGYFEKHHVIPRSMGGKNYFWNMVYLTYREHYIVHWLLTKMTEGSKKRKMIFALIQMTLTTTVEKRKGIIPSRWFDKSRNLRVNIMKGNKYGVGVISANKGKKASPELRAKLSASHKGKVLPKDQIEKIKIGQQKAYAKRRESACGNADWYKCAYCKKWDNPANLIIERRPYLNVYHKLCSINYHKPAWVAKGIRSSNNSYRARFKGKHLGSFSSVEDAKLAYENAVQNYFIELHSVKSE